MTKTENSMIEKLLIAVMELKEQFDNRMDKIESKFNEQQPIVQANAISDTSKISEQIEALSNTIINITKEEELPHITFTDFTEKYYCEMFQNRLSGERKLKKLRLSILNRMQKYFGNMNLQDITVQDIHGWIMHLESQAIKKLQPVTINRYCATMRAILNKAIEFKYLHKNVILNYNFKAPDNVNERMLTEHEINTLLYEARLSKNKDLYLALMIALNTGMRRGEILQLRKSDVKQFQELDYIRIRAENAKSNKERIVPLNENIKHILLQKIQKLNDDDFVFNTNFKKAYINCVERVKKHYNIPHFRFHDLRHTFATMLSQFTEGIDNIKNLLGHSTTRLTERYMHSNLKNLFDAVSKLNIPPLAS